MMNWDDNGSMSWSQLMDSLPQFSEDGFPMPVDNRATARQSQKIPDWECNDVLLSDNVSPIQTMQSKNGFKKGRIFSTTNPIYPKDKKMETLEREFDSMVIRENVCLYSSSLSVTCQNLRAELKEWCEQTSAMVSQRAASRSRRYRQNEATQLEECVEETKLSSSHIGIEKRRAKNRVLAHRSREREKTLRQQLEMENQNLKTEKEMLLHLVTRLVYENKIKTTRNLSDDTTQ